jgi:hypothetical protein
MVAGVDNSTPSTMPPCRRNNKNGLAGLKHANIIHHLLDECGGVAFPSPDLHVGRPAAFSALVRN